MPDKVVSPSQYQQIATTSFILFAQSMRLYEALLNHATENPRLLKEKEVQKGLARIIETIDTSGKGLESLPEPPLGFEAADSHFREIGKEIRTLANYLNTLIDSQTSENKQQTIWVFQAHAEKVKQNFQKAILSLNQEYSEGIF